MMWYLIMIKLDSEDSEIDNGQCRVIILTGVTSDESCLLADLSMFINFDRVKMYRCFHNIFKSLF